jgi:hypothetical protein
VNKILFVIILLLVIMLLMIGIAVAGSKWLNRF